MIFPTGRDFKRKAAGRTAAALTSAHGTRLGDRPRNSRVEPQAAVAHGRPAAGHARIGLEVPAPDKRPVSAIAGHTEVRSVKHVEIEQVNDLSVPFLCDPEHNFEERSLRELFEPYEPQRQPSRRR